MKFKMKHLMLLPFIVSLASCADTDELFRGNAYAQPGVTVNRYNDWDGPLSLAVPVSNVTLENEEHGYFNGSGVFDEPRDCVGFNQAKSWHPSWFKNEKGGDLYWVDPTIYSEIINKGIGTYADQSPLYDTVYSQNKKLSRFHREFSKGYLSKLYNGQTRCNAWSFYAMVFLDKEGYGTMFPLELSNAEYFAFVARGGRDTNDGGIGNVVSFDILVTFYRYKEDGRTLISEAVHLKEVYLQANRSSELTSMVGFTFKDAGINPKGIVGMSIETEGMDDPYRDEDGNVPSNDFNDGAAIHTGLCLYEVLIPDSEWY